MSNDEIVEKVLARLREKLAAPGEGIRIVLPILAEAQRRWDREWLTYAAQVWEQGWDARAAFERGAEPENPYRMRLEEM